MSMQPNQAAKRRRLDDRELLHELEKVNTNSGSSSGRRSGSTATTPTTGGAQRKIHQNRINQQREQGVYAPLPASVRNELGFARAGTKPVRETPFPPPCLALPACAPVART
jgi:hypothetical protein